MHRGWPSTQSSQLLGLPDFSFCCVKSETGRRYAMPDGSAMHYAHVRHATASGMLFYAAPHIVMR